MGKRGPKPKDPEMDRLEGRPGNRKPPPAVTEEDVSGGKLTLPLRLCVEERDCWRRVVASFPEWYFTAADRDLLTAYCRVWWRLEKAERALKTQPLVTKRANGSPCLNHNYQVTRDAHKELLSLSEALGMTKRTRRGIATTNPPITPASQAQGQMPTDPEDFGPGGDDPEGFGDLIQPPM